LADKVIFGVISISIAEGPSQEHEANEKSSHIRNYEALPPQLVAGCYSILNGVKSGFLYKFEEDG
jgi:hypothetical protein